MEGLLVFTTVALAGLAIYTLFNLLRFLRAADWNGTLQLLGAFVVGVIAAEWLAHASVTSSMVLIEGGPTVGKLDFGSLCLLGLGLGAIAPTVADFISSRDNSDSAAKPKLIP